MFDHFVEKNERPEIVGKIFTIKWNKDKCERRNHMFAQVGPISIAYKGYRRFFIRRILSKRYFVKVTLSDL